MPVLLLGFLALWLVLDRSAAVLGSYRGEAGILVCAIVLLAAILVEMAVARRGPYEAQKALGLVRADRRALLVTLALCAVLLAFYPLFALATGASLSLRPDWPVLLPGLFAQGGIAEETVFRGYLFRHFRAGRSFRQAALLSAIPFTAVHLVLFLTLDFPIALASVLLAVALAFPFAWVFEKGGNSILPPALLHFAVQGSIKLVETDPATMPTLAVAWIAASAVLPWAVFMIWPPSRAQSMRRE